MFGRRVYCSHLGESKRLYSARRQSSLNHNTHFMDSITQGVLGAAAAQAVMGRRLKRGAGLVGAIGGMAADLDVFIRSANDPTVSWLFHRHFTHSLIFIPLGGLLAALPFFLFRHYREEKRAVILASIIGYATHAPLDMFTSYGTQLFWPFTNYRVALDWIGIVDPVYTLPLWAGVIWTALKRNVRPVRIALAITTLYLIGFGAWQHHRAVEVQKMLAASRGHSLQHARALPAPGWLLLWRSVYVTEGRLVVDAIRLPWFGRPRVLAGGEADQITLEDLPAVARSNAETVRRFEVLRWFSDGLLAPIDGNPNAIGDERITAAVESLTPLWGLEIEPTTGTAGAWQPPRGSRDFGGLIKTLLLGDARYQTLAEQ